MLLFQQPPSSELRCLGAFIPTTTFIRALTSLLQIRQFAHLRSTSCSLQGLSSTQRSARATPSRDLTLGVEEQDRRPVRPMPIPTVSHHQGRAPGLVTKVAVLPPMGEGHKPREELEKTKKAEVMHGPWLELECTNPGSPRGQPWAREQEN